MYVRKNDIYIDFFTWRKKNRLKCLKTYLQYGSSWRYGSENRKCMVSKERYFSLVFKKHK